MCGILILTLQRSKSNFCPLLLGSLWPQTGPLSATSLGLILGWLLGKRSVSWNLKWAEKPFSRLQKQKNSIGSFLSMVGFICTIFERYLLVSYIGHRQVTRRSLIFVKGVQVINCECFNSSFELNLNFQTMVGTGDLQYDYALGDMSYIIKKFWKS